MNPGWCWPHGTTCLCIESFLYVICYGYVVSLHSSDRDTSWMMLWQRTRPLFSQKCMLHHMCQGGIRSLQINQLLTNGIYLRQTVCYTVRYVICRDFVTIYVPGLSGVYSHLRSSLFIHNFTWKLPWSSYAVRKGGRSHSKRIWMHGKDPRIKLRNPTARCIGISLLEVVTGAIAYMP